MPDDQRETRRPDGSSESSTVRLAVGQLRDDYYESTGTLSESIRKFCFGGIFIIWIFKSGNASGGLPFGKDLLWALGAFVLALVSDILQHVWKAIVLRRFLDQCRAANKNENDEAEIPRWVNEGTDYGFWLKIVITIGGYALICRHIVTALMQ